MDDIRVTFVFHNGNENTTPVTAITLFVLFSFTVLTVI